MGDTTNFEATCEALTELMPVLWGSVAIMSGLAMQLPSLIGIGAMSAFAFWDGTRAFAKARAMSD